MFGLVLNHFLWPRVLTNIVHLMTNHVIKSYITFELMVITLITSTWNNDLQWTNTIECINFWSSDTFILLVFLLHYFINRFINLY